MQYPKQGFAMLGTPFLRLRVAQASFSTGYQSYLLNSRFRDRDLSGSWWQVGRHCLHWRGAVYRENTGARSAARDTHWFHGAVLARLQQGSDGPSIPADWKLPCHYRSQILQRD